MTNKNLSLILENYFKEEFDKIIYFKHYFISRKFRDIDFEKFLESNLNLNTSCFTEKADKKFDLKIYKLENQERNQGKIAIWKLGDEHIVFIFTNSLDQRNREKIKDLSTNVCWLLDAWIPSYTVEDIFENYASEEEDTSIERKSDPYWLYKNYSKIPPNMQEFFNQHYEDFVKQEIEFSLKGPSWKIDDIYNQLPEELSEKLEISKSKFKMELSNPGSASISLDQSGLVSHRTGTPKATLKVLDDVESDMKELYQKFSTIIPKRKYERLESGIVRLTSFTPPKTLKIKFINKPFNEEASIKLSNLLTVGHKDLKIFGTIQFWEGKEFFVRSNLIFDEGVYEIYLSEEDNHPTLYIKPIEGSTSGLIYIYIKN